PRDLAALPGPYGPVEVGANGADLGLVHVRMLVTDHDWHLTVSPRPEGVDWHARVCTAGGFQAGAEVKFAIDIVAPAGTAAASAPPTCGLQIGPSSGEQGKTLGAGFPSKTVSFDYTFSVPSGHGPLGGPLLSAQPLGSAGYDDGFVRIRVLVSRNLADLQF